MSYDCFEGYEFIAVLISLPRQPTSNQSESRIKCFTTKAIIFQRRIIIIPNERRGGLNCFSGHGNFSLFRVK
ncbi:hypothetical protein TSAR_014599 [Trichomalopsis sarcophagae]|uniref:Uncharacterized protein n=1 Tax=Trichomalopsis sarcophagae TaxID=543379 RepID=A0A232F262_9HYME|nr:hypothetical protein TSAR_014599 [Trichomalopsis sarcophagae]